MMMMGTGSRIGAVVAVGIALLSASCQRDSSNGTARGDSTATPDVTAQTPAVPQMTIEIIRRIPHDETAYTQGLVFRDALLYESDGRYQESRLRVIDPKTGRELEKKAMPNNVFAEGLAWTGEAFVQLTWQELVAYYYDPRTLLVTKTVPYDGQGWGLCYDGSDLYMTSGNDQLIRRNAKTFAVIDTKPITRGGQPLHAANELECVGDYIWANIYRSLQIVKIDKRTGAVVAEIDGTPLVPAGVNAMDGDHVLNGIAYSEKTQTFYVTGKLWPEMLEVRFK